MEYVVSGRLLTLPQITICRDRSECTYSVAASDHVYYYSSVSLIYLFRAFPDTHVWIICIIHYKECFLIQNIPY